MKPRGDCMVKSMIKHQQQSVHGLLPVWSHMANDNWCMSGYHSTSVLTDAITKGADVNKEEALKAMVVTSNVSYYDGIGDYIKLGYVPFDVNGTAASTTLEYAYDDWTIYKTALNMGYEEVASQYRKRALNYHHIFDKELGFAVRAIKMAVSKKSLTPCKPMAKVLLKETPGISLSMSLMMYLE